MTGFFVTLYNILNAKTVAGGLGGLDAGLTIFGLFSIIKEKISKDSLEYQLLCVIETSLKDTFEEMGWEYDSITVSENLNITKLLDDGRIMSEEGLKEIFEDITGQECDNKTLEVIERNFNKTAASNQIVFQYISLQSNRYGSSRKSKARHRTEYTHIERQYIAAMDNRQFSEGISTKTLADTYIANEYYIAQNEKRDDLIYFLYMFIEGDFNGYLKDYNILDNSSEEINTLIITATQCCGKTSLVSKLLYDYYRNDYKGYALYVTNFRDERHKRTPLSIDMICKSLEIDEAELENAVLILDSIEESELPASQIQDMVEILSSNLKEYGCKLIVTCRNNIVDLDELRECIEINLCNFSPEKVDEWIKACKFKIDEAQLNIIVRSVKSEYSQVLCLPYILKICIECGLDLKEINDLGQLYDKAFIVDADLLYSRYDPPIRLTTSQVKRLKKTIFDVAEACVYSEDKAITARELNAFFESNEEAEKRVFVSLFFVRKEGERYYFLHESIQDYFVAKRIYDDLLIALKNDYKAVADFIKRYVREGVLISRSVYEFVFHFIKRNNDIKGRELDFIKDYLSGKHEDYLKMLGNYRELRKFHYACYVFVVNIFAAIIKTRANKNDYTLFERLNDDETKNMIELSTLGDADMDMLGDISFSNVILDGFNFAHIDFTNRRRIIKIIKNASIKCAVFNSAYMAGLYIIDADLTSSTFVHTDCTNIQIHRCVMRDCTFVDADLRGATIEESDVSFSDLRGAKLHKVTFRGTNITGIKIESKQLKELLDFMPDTIRENKIRIYKDGIELPEELIEEEFSVQRPAAFQVYIHPGLKKSRNRKH